MLLALDISSFALIDKLYIEFGDGLNIITGETGAGKSIVVDSINFILGSKFSKDIIKKGRDKAEIKAMFDLTDEQIKYAENLGFKCTDSTVSIHRSINSSSKSICRFNDKIITLTNLKELASAFMEVHGQHENQALLGSNNHMFFLDVFAFKNNPQTKINFDEKFKNFKGLRSSILEQNMDGKKIAAKMEQVKEELKEFSKLKWKKGEEELLQSQVDEMENMENINIALSTSINALYKDDDNAYEQLKVAMGAMDNIKDCSSKYGELYARISSVYYELEDIVDAIRSNISSFDFSSEQLSDMQRRLFEFSKLKKRYGKDENELLTYMSNLKEEYGKLEYNLSHAKELRQQLKGLYVEAIDAAIELSKMRKDQSVALEREIMAHLDDLGMKNAKFKVDFIEKDLGETGVDTIEFLFCANKGQDLKPLSKVASGGEISRLMLSLKNVDLDSSTVDAMVFDEIDTGISGKMAQAVAVKLANISKSKQVICVTHLPQVCAMGDLNIFVEKSEAGEDTVIKASRLGEQDRISEVARLISGDGIAASALSHAKELILESKKYKIN